MQASREERDRGLENYKMRNRIGERYWKPHWGIWALEESRRTMKTYKQGIDLITSAFSEVTCYDLLQRSLTCSTDPSMGFLVVCKFFKLVANMYICVFLKIPTVKLTQMFEDYHPSTSCKTKPRLLDPFWLKPSFPVTFHTVQNVTALNIVLFLTCPWAFPPSIPFWSALLFPFYLHLPSPPPTHRALSLSQSLDEMFLPSWGILSYFFPCCSLAQGRITAINFRRSSYNKR